MFKRILLALTFVAALVTTGVGMSSRAEAGHGCHYGGDYGYYGHHGHGYRVHRDYGYYRPHRSYFGPRYGHYDAFYGGHHGHHRHHGYHGHHGHGSGVHFSIGF